MAITTRIAKPQFQGMKVTASIAADKAASAAYTAPGGAGAPPAIAPPPPTPMPWDTNFETQKANSQARYDNTMSGLNYQQDQTTKQYGIGDTTDPFSNMKLLQQAYDQHKQAAGNQMAARGQLYSGAYQNAQNNETTNFNQSSDALTKKYNAAINGINQQKAQASLTQADTNATADYNRVQTTLANRPDPSLTDPTAGTTATTQTPRQAAVLSALKGSLGGKVRARLVAEARKNGWL